MRTPRPDEGAEEGQRTERADPVGPQRFVPRERLIETFGDAPPIDFEQFRKDLYSIVDPSPRIWYED